MRKSRYVGNSDASSLTVDTVVCFPSELQLSLQRSFSGCCSSLRLEFLCDAIIFKFFNYFVNISNNIHINEENIFF